MNNRRMLSITVVKDSEPPKRDPVSGKFRQVWAKAENTAC